MYTNINRPTRDKTNLPQHPIEQRKDNKQFCIRPGSRPSAIQIGDQHASRRYVQVNNQSCVWIKSGLVKQAVEMLENCEKQIQSNADIKQNLDENVWNALLHNLAGAHQKLGNFSKSLDYLRSLLHNINIKTPKYEQQCDFQTRVTQFSLGLTLAKYYIYFLALALELHMLEAASIPINRIFDFFRKFAKDYRKSGLSLTLINTKMSENLLSQIEQFESVFNKSNQWQVYNSLKQAVLKLHKIPFSEISASKIRKFSINNLTQMSPLEASYEKGNTGSKHICHRMFQNGLIQFSVALFLMGKSQFQSVSSKYKNKQDDFKKLATLDKCRMYIVWSLYFCCSLCPYLTPLHQEIFTFYEDNLRLSTGSEYNNFKVANSSISPSDYGPWEIIKRHFIKLNEQKDEKREGSKRYSSNFLLNQQNFQEAVEAGKEKQLTKQNSISISYNRTKRNSSLQLFEKERELFRKQAKLETMSHQKRKSQKIFVNMEKLDIRRKPKNSSPAKYKLNGKNKRMNKQKSQHSIHSIRSTTSLRKSIKKKGDRLIKRKDHDGVLNEYYVTPQRNKLKTTKNQKSQGKQLVSNYLSLEKKIKQSTRSLSKKKNALLNCIKKL